MSRCTGLGGLGAWGLPRQRQGVQRGVTLRRRGTPVVWGAGAGPLHASVGLRARRWSGSAGTRVAGGRVHGRGVRLPTRGGPRQGRVGTTRESQSSGTAGKSGRAAARVRGTGTPSSQRLAVPRRSYVSRPTRVPWRQRKIMQGQPARPGGEEGSARLMLLRGGGGEAHVLKWGVLRPSSFQAPRNSVRREKRRDSATSRSRHLNYTSPYDISIPRGSSRVPPQLLPVEKSGCHARRETKVLFVHAISPPCPPPLQAPLRTQWSYPPPIHRSPPGLGVWLVPAPLICPTAPPPVSFSSPLPSSTRQSPSCTSPREACPFP